MSLNLLTSYRLLLRLAKVATVDSVHGRERLADALKARFRRYKPLRVANVQPVAPEIEAEAVLRFLGPAVFKKRGKDGKDAVSFIHALSSGCGNMVYRDHVLSGLCTKAVESIMLKPSDSTWTATTSAPDERATNAASTTPATDTPSAAG